MRLNFRQGIVRAPVGFLTSNADKVNLSLPPNEQLLFTIADGNNNYLITERLSVTNAWTGPFAAGPTDYWLYWDINVQTGVKTYGHTILSPVEGAVAPVTPANDQHWFDTVNNVMKVWNATAGRWVRKLRVFAAELQGGAVFTSISINAPLYTGTQVGSLSSVSVNAGALVFDGVTGLPIKKSDGTFFTTETVALTGIAGSTEVKMGSLVIEAEAAGNIPAYSIVSFTAFNKINTATNYLVDNFAYGIVTSSVTTGEVANVIMEGLIQNESWDWTAAGVNASLYIDSLGALTTVVPPTPIVVASVIDKTSILLRPSSLFVDSANDPATITNSGSVKISVAAVDINDPIAVGDNDPRITAVTPHIADTEVHLPVLGTANQLVGVNAGATAPEYKTIAGTTNQVTVTQGVGTVTLSTPQNLHTAASVQFASVLSNNNKTSVVSLTDAANIAWDLSQGTIGTVTIAGDRVLDTPINIPAGVFIVLQVTQDGTGGHSLSYGAAFKFTGGVAPVIAAGIGEVSVITFVTTGTTELLEVSRSLNVA